MGLLGHYRNGNYEVSIFSDGTKVRENDLDFFAPDFPENIDTKITNKCSGGTYCPYCHEGSTPDGCHGDLNADFIKTLRPHTELAIGGGNPLEHPQLLHFLNQLKEQKIIANITINQVHFMEHSGFVQSLCDHDLVHGVGISLRDPSDEFLDRVSKIPNAVIHVINGIVTAEQLRKLAGRGLKVLILGYKDLRRGARYHDGAVDARMRELYDALPSLMQSFRVLSFDNLALEQLEVKRLVPQKVWAESYMGDDGQYTMYIDMVNREFASSSVSPHRYPLTSSIDDMFAVIRHENMPEEVRNND